MFFALQLVKANRFPRRIQRDSGLIPIQYNEDFDLTVNRHNAHLTLECSAPCTLRDQHDWPLQMFLPGFRHRLLDRL